MEKEEFAFGKINFIMIGISMLIVVIGFIMMTGAQSTDTHFAPEIFSSMRVKVAPLVCLFGFVSVICGIMYKPKNNKEVSK